MEVAIILGVILLAYFLGSLTPGLWVARWYGVDIQKVGSGNIGSTNVYRVLGFWPGLLVQVVDIVKALIPALLAQRLNFSSWTQYSVVTAAVIGHVYPIWAGFRGGKGVNTLLGGMLPISPLTTLAALGTFLIVLALFRIVSLSSLVAIASFLVWHAKVGSGEPSGYLFGVFWTLGVVYTHRQNLQRLWAGTEPRIGTRTH
ncbi:MAG: glycerol-3-phosphate 1-O-acyltransferase PlsY [Bacteroidia bacterium]|nr:glycerol-3-phosphate 1-O-acyltransferase PlsY [Bacteroidia bacterium]MDW8133700.1 glycerol-3-phosphate 1-O-acyltransferase PlsY [Bacteroidia bacterium]